MKIYNRSNWMSLISEEEGKKSLCRFSIPGTHNSGTEKTIKGGVAHCQNFSIQQQLLDGIRFLDIRLKNDGENLQLYHGSENCHVNFDTVLKWCRQFLEENPTETILMSVKQEESGVLIPNLNAHIQKYLYLFVKDENNEVASEIPTLNSARGKIVLFSQIKNLKGVSWNIDCVEDNYEISFTQEKINCVEAALDMAIGDAYKNQFFVSFCNVQYHAPHTAYQFAWSVEPAINPNICKYIKKCGYNKRLGVVVLDYYNNNNKSIEDNSLVDGIIQSNFQYPVIESYDIEIQTGDESGAGTDSNITLIIHGSKNSYPATVLNPLLKGNAFERNNLDSCVLSFPYDIGDITKIVLRSDHKYAGADWCVQSVKITRKTTGEVFIAEPKAWITNAADYESSVKKISSTPTPSPKLPESYYVGIKTGDKSGAGTDSNITLTIESNNGSYPATVLNPLLQGNAFERNNLNSCVLSFPNYNDIGDITKIVLQSDHKYAGADWYVDSVRIIRKTTGELFFAEINQWIEDTKDHEYTCVTI